MPSSLVLKYLSCNPEILDGSFIVRGMDQIGELESKVRH